MPRETIVDRLMYVLGMDIEGLEKGTKRADRLLSGFVRNIDKMLGVGLVGLGLAELGQQIVGVGVEATNAAMDMERLEMALRAVTGSAEEAELQFAKLREVAKLPGLGLEEAVQGSIRLQAVGLNARLAERALMGVGNALASVGAGRAELSGVLLAFTQMIAKGKVLSEEINQVAERMPQVRRLMQQAFGTANTEAIQKMGMTAEQFIESLVVEMEKLPKMTETTANAFENLDDMAFQLKANFGKLLLPTVASGLDMISGAMDRLNQMFESASDASRRLLSEFEQARQEADATTESLASLVDEYDSLNQRMEKGDMTSQQMERSQKRLHEIVQDIVVIVPDAATGWNSYGEAISFSKDKVLEFIQIQKQMLGREFVSRVQDATTQIDALKEKIKNTHLALSTLRELPEAIISEDAFVEMIRLLRDGDDEAQAWLLTMRQSGSVVARELARQADTLRRITTGTEDVRLAYQSVGKAVTGINPRPLQERLQSLNRDLQAMQRGLSGLLEQAGLSDLVIQYDRVTRAIKRTQTEVSLLERRGEDASEQVAEMALLTERQAGIIGEALGRGFGKNVDEAVGSLERLRQAYETARPPVTQPELPNVASELESLSAKIDAEMERMQKTYRVSGANLGREFLEGQKKAIEDGLNEIGMSVSRAREQLVGGAEVANADALKKLVSQYEDITLSLAMAQTRSLEQAYKLSGRNMGIDFLQQQKAVLDQWLADTQQTLDDIIEQTEGTDRARADSAQSFLDVYLDINAKLLGAERDLADERAKRGIERYRARVAERNELRSFWRDVVSGYRKVVNERAALEKSLDGILSDLVQAQTSEQIQELQKRLAAAKAKAGNLLKVHKGSADDILAIERDLTERVLDLQAARTAGREALDFRDSQLMKSGTERIQQEQELVSKLSNMIRSLRDAAKKGDVEALEDLERQLDQLIRTTPKAIAENEHFAAQFGVLKESIADAVAAILDWLTRLKEVRPPSWLGDFQATWDSKPIADWGDKSSKTLDDASADWVGFGRDLNQVASNIVGTWDNAAAQAIADIGDIGFALVRLGATGGTDLTAWAGFVGGLFTFVAQSFRDTETYAEEQHRKYLQRLERSADQIGSELTGTIRDTFRAFVEEGQEVMPTLETMFDDLGDVLQNAILDAVIQGTLIEEEAKNLGRVVARAYEDGVLSEQEKLDIFATKLRLAGQQNLAREQLRELRDEGLLPKDVTDVGALNNQLSVRLLTITRPQADALQKTISMGNSLMSQVAVNTGRTADNTERLSDIYDQLSQLNSKMESLPTNNGMPTMDELQRSQTRDLLLRRRAQGRQ